jgi:hypothetical protein
MEISMSMIGNARLVIAGFFFVTPTLGHAQSTIKLEPLFPLKLSTKVDAGAALDAKETARQGRKIALMDVAVAATLFDAQSKLYAMIPQMNMHFACNSGAAVGATISNIGLDLPSENPRSLRATVVASARRCGPGPSIDMKISTTFTAVVSANKRIELKAESPQVGCDGALCYVVKPLIIDALTPKINESAAMVGAWIDRQIKQPMDKYQQPPYNLKIQTVSLNPAKATGNLKDIMVQITLSGQAPVEELDAGLQDWFLP